MSLQDHIAPYLNRFVILFHQNATAKLELSCTDGKVNVNIHHELGVIKQDLPPTAHVKKTAYNEVLKKNMKPSQFNRLKRRAAARVEEAKTETIQQKKGAEQALEGSEEEDHVSELHKVAAAKANCEAHGINSEVEKTMAIADAEKAISDNAFKMACAEAGKATIDESFNKVCPRHHKGVCPHKRCGPFVCTFCRGLYGTREEFVEHQSEAYTEKNKCELCGKKLNCFALNKHMNYIHGKDLQWVVKAYN
jgi:hypothetical protein